MQPVKWTPRGVFLSALIVLCGVTSLQAQRIREPRAVKAVDALGKEIGTVLKMDFYLQSMQVAVEVNDTLVPILVRKDSFSHGSRPPDPLRVQAGHAAKKDQGAQPYATRSPLDWLHRNLLLIGGDSSPPARSPTS